MIILQLRLHAFGPFTERQLDFSGGQEGLHVVYGPNEAGKSSMLRALRQAIYGIPVRSTDAFIHPYARLRIGAKLRRSDGTELDFIRRKGRKNTLYMPDDETVIAESSLNSFLGGVDETLFSMMFGIGHTDLVQGGQDILRGDGDIGQILFAAGSGIAELRKVQDTLQEDAETLFKPTGTNPRINEALSSLKEKHKAVRDAQLSDQDWSTHDNALSQAQRDKEVVDNTLVQKQREKSRLERIREALPLMGLRAEHLSEFEAYKDVILLPDDFSDRRREALTKLNVAEKVESQACKNIETLNNSLDELDVPEKLLAYSEDIEKLFLNLGSHEKAMYDRIGLVREQETLERDAIDILHSIHPDVTVEQADQFNIGKSESIRIDELGDEYTRLKTRIDERHEEISKSSHRIKRLKKQVDEIETILDTEKIQRVLNQVRQQVSLEKQYENLCDEIGREEKKIKTALKKQNLWAGTFEALEALSIPSSETIDMFEQRLNEAQDNRSKCKTNIDEIENGLLELNSQFDALRLELEVPTEEALAETRLLRDEGWSFIRRAWDEGSDPPKDHEALSRMFPLAGNLTEAYEHSVRASDEISDRLRREADRVATQAQLLADREKRKSLLEKLKQQLETTTTALTNVNQDWSVQWEPSGIVPKSPKEMRQWAQKQEKLAEQASVLQEKETESGKIKSQLDELRQTLNECFQQLGVSPPDSEKRLENLLEDLQHHVETIETEKEKREQLFSKLTQQEQDMEESEALVETAEQQLLVWKIKWEEAVAPLGLDVEASPAQANAVVQESLDLSGKLKDVQKLRKRIEDIDKDAGDYRNEVYALVKSIASDLAGLPVEQVATELHARLKDARQLKTEQDHFEQDRKKEEDRRQTSQDEITGIRAQLDTMCEETECEAYDQLQGAEERSKKRLDLQNTLKEIEEKLHALSAGSTLGDFSKDVQSVDADSIESDLSVLEEEIAQLNEEKSKHDQTIGSEKTELNKMDGNTRAGDLAEEAQNILAHLESDVEKYVQLRLASVVLKQAIEDYREKNQGTILQQASNIFRALTIESFDRLRVEPDDNGKDTVVGIRSKSDEIVEVEGMSDGTVDQLYLAFRLASLDSYLEEHEPMPFIIDDILINFDNDRSIATLQSLARLSKKTQVVFFTHHKHLVELAENRIDPEILFVHTLG